MHRDDERDPPELGLAELEHNARNNRMRALRRRD